MGQDEPEPVQPEGDDPGVEVAEGETVAAAEPEPEGDDPGKVETFSLELDSKESLNLSDEG